MTVYLVVFLLLSGLALFRGRKAGSEVLLWAVLAGLIVLVGTRLNTGCDFSSYEQRFLTAAYYDSLTEAISGGEAGFQSLVYVTRSMGLDYVWLNVFCALIFFTGVGFFVRRHPEPLVVVALMFPILVVQLSMSGVRQAIAVSFLMLALVAFMDRKRLLSVIWIFLGATFHQSLLLFLPLAWMSGRRLSVPRVLAALAILGPLALILISERIQVYGDRYVEQIYGESESVGGLIRLGLLLATAFVFELYKKRVMVAFPDQFLMMRVFSLITFALVPVAMISTVAVHRLGFYVIPVQLFTLAILPLAIFGNQINRSFFRLVPLAVYATYMIVWFTTSRHAQVCYSPYNSYLLGQ